MKAHFAASIIAVLTLSTISAAHAHGVARVTKELKEQGYEQLEYQRKRPPFKLDACRDGTLYHLHVDFYGKVTKKTVAGDCNQEEYTEPDPENSTPENETAVDESPQPSIDNRPTEETSADDEPSKKPVTEDAIARCWRYGGGDACRSLEQN